MQTMMRLVVLAFLALALTPEMASAQAPKTEDFTMTASDVVVTRSHPGQCWHYSNWIPTCAIESCDTSGKPVVVPIVAPTEAKEISQSLPVESLPQKISVSADALFAFDDSALKPEGQALLDDVVHQLNGAIYNVISVTGYADRFGHRTYNQMLSERRANSVKEYLVSRAVLASRIVARGKGATESITRSGECAGASSAKVIACLQPDRRVEVAMHGIEAIVSLR